MKNRYIIGGLAVALMTPALVSCGDDFLSEEPITNISSVTVNTSEEGANAAVTGLVRQMQRQFTDLKNGNLNASGETFFANIYGEALGPDNNVGEATNYMRTGIKPANFRYATGWWPSWMYKYCYSIIGSANSILTNLSEDPTNDNELWLKASALTMRAHAYTRLMQVYAPRWIDSNNGEKHCIVLRIKSGEPNENSSTPATRCMTNSTRTSTMQSPTSRNLPRNAATSSSLSTRMWHVESTHVSPY